MFWVFLQECPVNQANAAYLTERLRCLDGITPPIVKPECQHGYYGYSIKLDAARVGVSRDLFVKALRAEGIPTSKGYVEPIYLQPIYQKRQAYGKQGCPFSCPHAVESHVSYQKGICPVAERMYYEEWMGNALVYQGVERADLDDIYNAYEKVLNARSELTNKVKME